MDEYRETRLPPEKIFRAYAKLLSSVFVYLRNYDTTQAEREEIAHLGDALHNIAQFLTEYGEWIDDEKFRKLFIRPFDEKWGDSSINLEKILKHELKE